MLADQTSVEKIQLNARGAADQSGRDRKAATSASSFRFLCLHIASVFEASGEAKPDRIAAGREPRGGQHELFIGKNSERNEDKQQQ